MRFHYFVSLPTSQDCLIPIIPFLQFAPEDRLAANNIFCVFVDTHRKNLSNGGYTLSAA